LIETRAPGKLFIVGEYAVVEAGEPAVLVSVDRLLHVRLTERDAPVACGASEHVLAAIRAVDELRAHRGLPERHFEIETESELEDERGRKFGLGSSAAVTVAVVEALDRLHGLGLDPVERFRLALLATIEVSPRASGGDLASSTFGGWILYRSPDRAELRAHRAAHGIASALVCDAWRRCEVRRLPAPRDLELLVGWTGSPASTRQLVDGVSPQQPAAPLDQPAFLAASRDCVEALAGALAVAEASLALLRAELKLARSSALNLVWLGFGLVFLGVGAWLATSAAIAAGLWQLTGNAFVGIGLVALANIIGIVVVLAMMRRCWNDLSLPRTRELISGLQSPPAEQPLEVRKEERT